jgi:hypothetical protein
LNKQKERERETMMNIRYRNNTNAWPGFVDLFSNLVIILIFLLIMFLLLWTTTSVFNKTTGTRAVAELKQANAEQAQTIEQMESYKREANRLLLLARDELENMDLSTEDLINAYEIKIVEMKKQQKLIVADAEAEAQLKKARAEAEALKLKGASENEVKEKLGEILKTHPELLKEVLAKNFPKVYGGSNIINLDNILSGAN